MTPLDQGKERLMAFECGAASAGQEAKAIIQPRRNLFGRKDLGSRGGEFNRQRDAVQPSADICNRRCILLLEAEGWVCCHCAINEEAHTVILRKCIEIMELLWVWQWKGWNAIGCLAGDAQRLPAGRQYFQTRRDMQKTVSDLCTCFNQMFAIIQDHHHALRTHIIRERI